MKQKLLLLLVAWLPIAAFCDYVKVGKLWYNLGSDATATVVRLSDNDYEAADNFKGFKEILEIGEEFPDLKDGDKFTATNAEGVEMTFKVISAADKTCEVARQLKDWNTIVTSPYPESITIPAEVKGFKVISIGYQAFYEAKGIKSVIIPEGVTSINTHAFRECDYLASITLPKSLEKCGTGSFEDCAFGATVHISDLESWCNVSLPSWDLYGWHLFLNGEEVNNLVIPDGVTSIGESMQHISPLSNCASLTSVTIPSSVTKMYSPFSGCSNLTSVTTFAEEPVAIYTGFPNAANSMSNSIGNATLYVPKGSKAAYEAADYWKAFKEIVEMGGEESDLKDGDIFTALTPEGVEMTFKVISATGKTCQIGDGENCSFSSSYSGTITIPATANGYSVITIAPWACGQSNITAAIISQGIQNIEDRAFGFNSNLVSISLPEGLTRIGNNIVWGCSKLSSFHVPSTVQEFETQFGWCDALEQITVAEGNTIYDSRDNCNAVIEKATNTLIAGCKATIIPNTVERLSSTSFGFLPSLTEMIIPEGVKALDNQVFAYTSLSTITIPSTVESIGSSSFENCDHLVEVRVNRKTPFTLRDDVFTDIAYNGTLYVPKGSKALYDADDVWSNFQNIVEMEPEEIIAFADSKVKNICVENWDTNKDGELSTKEAAAVTDFGNLFWGKHISSFDEIKYFTGITSLADEAFYFNTSLTSFTLPSFITSLGVRVFAENYSTKLSVDPDNPVYDSRNNCNAIVETATNKIVAACGGTEIPSSVKTIGEAAFFGSFSLTAIDIPATVECIEKDAFNDCRYLESVTVHRTIPLSIAEDCFNWWDQDNGVYQKTKATLYVPKGSKAAYETADGWKDFKEIVEVKFGDADDDGEVSQDDVELVKEYIMVGKAEGLNFSNADMNGNKQLNVADIVKMINIIKSKNSQELDPEAAEPQPDQEEESNDF